MTENNITAYQIAYEQTKVEVGFDGNKPLAKRTLKQIEE